MATNTTTRRALLGAITAVPVAAIMLTTPAPAAPDRRAFDQALAEYRRCYAEQEAFHAANVMPASRACDGLENSGEVWRAAFDKCCRQEDMFIQYVSRTGEALDRLLGLAVAPAQQRGSSAPRW